MCVCGVCACVHVCAVCVCACVCAVCVCACVCDLFSSLVTVCSPTEGFVFPSLDYPMQGGIHCPICVVIAKKTREHAWIKIQGWEH